MNSALKQRFEYFRGSVNSMRLELHGILVAEWERNENLPEGLKQASSSKEIYNIVDDLKTIDDAFETIGESLERIINY